VHNPYTENELPSRAKLRTDKLELRLVQSNTLQLDPNFEIPNTDKLLPKRAKLRIEIALPM
jgi:hypothetical protein